MKRFFNSPHGLLIRQLSLGLFSTMLIAATLASRKPVTWICGDSTGTDNAGWGGALQSFLNAEMVEVRNKSVGGRSSKSFIEEKSSWPSFKDDILEGDVVIVQFGHNDNKPHSPERYTIPETTYKEYLTVFLDHCKKVGATPVLATSIVRKRWKEDGTMQPTHGDYPDAMRSLAKEKNVALVDLTKLTKEHFEKIGEKASSRFYRDGSHLKKEGATVVTDMLIKSVVAQNIMPLCSWVKDSPCKPTSVEKDVAGGPKHKSTISYNSAKKALCIDARDSNGFSLNISSLDGQSVYSKAFDPLSINAIVEIPLHAIGNGTYLVRSQSIGASRADIITITP